MKTAFHYSVPNLKGKKTYDAPCGCCTARNLKEWYWEKFYRKYLRYF